MRALLLYIAALFLLLSRKPQRQTVELQTDPEEGQKEKSSYHRQEHHGHPSEEEHRTAEQHNWKLQNTTNILTVIAASAAALFAYQAFKQSERQADAAWDQNRPWVTLQVTNTRVLVNQNRNALIAAVTTVNTGHLVATSVSMKFAFVDTIEGKADEFGTPFGDDIIKVREDVCRKSAENGTLRGGSRLPGAQDNPTMLIELNDASKSSIPTTHTFELVSCVTYRFAGSRELHQTAAVFVVGKKVSYSPEQELMPGVTAERLIPNKVEPIRGWNFPAASQTIEDAVLTEIDLFGIAN